MITVPFPIRLADAARTGIPLRLTSRVTWDKPITVVGGWLRLEAVAHPNSLVYTGKGHPFNFVDMKYPVFDFRLVQKDPEAEGVLFSGESHSWGKLTGRVEGGRRGFTWEGTGKGDLCKWHIDTCETSDCTEYGFKIKGFNAVDFVFTNIGAGGSAVGVDFTEGGSQALVQGLTCSGTKIPLLVTGGINVEAYGIVSEGAETVIKVTNASNYSIQRYRIADARGGTTGNLVEMLKNGLAYLDIDRADNLKVHLESQGTELEVFTSGLTPKVSAKGKVYVDGALQLVK